MSRTLPWRCGASPFSRVSMKGSCERHVSPEEAGILQGRFSARNRTQQYRSSSREEPDILWLPRMRLRDRSSLVTLLAIALFAWFLRHANLADVWAQVRRARVDLLVCAVLCAVVLTYVIRAYRWQYLLHPIGPTRFRTAFRTTVIGFAALGVLPARAGDVLRPYLLARQEGLSTSATLRDGRHGARARPDRRAVAAGALSSGASSDPSTLPPALLRPDRSVGGAGGRGGGRADGVMWVLATHPERIGRLVFSAARVLPQRAGRPAGASWRSTFSSGFAVAREPRAARAGAVLVVSAVAGDRGRSLAGHRRLRHRHAVYRHVPAAGAARDRRRGADAGRRRQLSRGLPHWRHDVLRRAERRGGRARRS